ncbi:hypothetical protein GJ496_010184, partial [Pomphorhynchus laevis]
VRKISSSTQSLSSKHSNKSSPDQKTSCSPIPPDFTTETSRISYTTFTDDTFAVSSQLFEHDNDPPSEIDTSISNLTDQSNIDQLPDNCLLQSRIKELESKLLEMTNKRSQDKHALRDYEKAKVQILQLQEYKAQSQNQLNEVKKQLQITEKKYNLVNEELSNNIKRMDGIDDQIESLTLDREMSEEKAESLEIEVSELQKQLEEVTLEYEILKTQVENPESVDVVTTHRCEQQQSQIRKLNTALLTLRDSSFADKNKIAELSKANEKLTTQLAQFSQLNIQLKKENEVLESAKMDLTEQVDAALGSENIISTLTDKNLLLEEKLEELTEQINDLKAMCEIDNEIHDNLKEQNKDFRNQIEMLNIAFLEICKIQIHF